MATQILMPALSPTMTEGKLARWLKSVGDEVRAGDVIAEIETDKATMEVEAVDEGKLAQILVTEGTEGVPVNTPIAVLAANGESAAAAPASPAPPAPAPPAAPAPGRRRAGRTRTGGNRARRVGARRRIRRHRPACRKRTGARPPTQNRARGAA